MKTGRILLAGLFCMALLATPAFAASGHLQQPQSLSLVLQGMITNAGNQQYQLSGGSLVAGSALFGQPLTSAKVQFDFTANVHGLQSVSGTGTLEVSSQGGDSWGPGNGGHGGQSDGVELSAHISITGAVPAAIFPITLTSPTSYASCDPETSTTCNSEIPLLFTGVATIDSQSGHGQTQLPIAIESPYWNPFGGAILITSLDSPTNPSIFLIVHYNSATINWSGVQLQGIVDGGAFGTEQITGGYYGQSVNSFEDLVKGSELDLGSIAFTGMSDQTLNGNGYFLGHTSFTSTPSFDCSLQFGLPEGTCLATGATSNGSYFMKGQNNFDSGKYETTWSVPSLFTVTTVIGAVYQT